MTEEGPLFRRSQCNSLCVRLCHKDGFYLDSVCFYIKFAMINLKNSIMKKAYSFIIVLSLALGPMIAGVFGQEKAATPVEVQNLMKFIGMWKGDMTMKDSQQKTFSIKQTVVCTPIAGGSGIYIEEVSESPDMGKMTGSDIMGYDPYAKQLHCFTVDNMGTAHDHLCTWKNDNHLYMEHNSVRDGKTYQEKIDMVFTDKTHLQFSMTTYVDGKTMETGEGTMNKTAYTKAED